MTTTTATLLHRNEQALPAPGVLGRSNRLVAGGLTSDGQPTGALFFWSHTRFHDEFLFELHRHEGFEIVSVILEGSTGHFDTSTARWADLRAGDVQIIRSGSGISHRERATPGARVFQIWFDPDFWAALRREPSYADYPAAALVAPGPRTSGEARVTDLIGGDGPVDARTEGLAMRRVDVPAGASTRLELDPGHFAIAYLIDGEASVNGTWAAADDAVPVEGAEHLVLQAHAPSDVFVVALPADPSYRPVRSR